MATLEQIIEEARRLPVEEQRRLRAALESLDSNGEVKPANQELSPQKPQSLRINNGDDEIRHLRMEWLKSHREEHGGQYVALDGDQLLAVGSNYRIARESARGRQAECIRHLLVQARRGSGDGRLGLRHQLAFTELVNYWDMVQRSATLRLTGEAHNEPKLTKRLGSSATTST